MSAPGYFGKVTTHGDFVSRGLAPQMIAAWDGWLQQCIHASRQQLGDGWLSRYLTSPLWRFAAAPGVLGEQGWAGVMMPSVDRVGRHFPLMLAAPLARGAALTALVTNDMAWYDALEELARASLEPDFMLEQLQIALAPMAAPRIAPGPAGWRLPIGERNELPPGLTDFLLQEHSLWWTEGAPGVEPSMLACRAMPAPDAFAAMLDGRWREQGWGASAGSAPAAP